MAISSEKRREMMLSASPYKIIPLLAGPSIAAALVDCFYNLADTYFVSSISDTATAAVSINDSFMQILMAIASGFAFGLSSYSSRLLGAKDDEHASSVASTIYSIGLCFAVTVILFYGQSELNL